MGGGVFLRGGTLAVENTIIADNAADNGADYYYSGGALTDNGYNLVESQDGSSTGSGKTFTAGTDILGQDPELGDLGAYGGDTQTLLLCKVADGTDNGCNSATSPAINVIPPGGQCGGSAPYNVDQRGIARPYDTNCDMGAYERTGSTLVELISFTAEPRGSEVELLWQTASEIDTAGFNLWRSDTIDGFYEKINLTLIPGEGSPETGASYEFIDDECPLLDCVYKLEDIDTYGESAWHGPIRVEQLPGLCGTMNNAWGFDLFLLLLLPAAAVLWLIRRKRKHGPTAV